MGSYALVDHEGDTVAVVDHNQVRFRAVFSSRYDAEHFVKVKGLESFNLRIVAVEVTMKD